MITTKKAYPYIEITCEPDDEYQYIRCDSSAAGLFFIRHRLRSRQCNIWIFKDGEGRWGEDILFDLETAEVSATCKMSRVTEPVTITLPTREVYESSKFN